MNISVSTPLSEAYINTLIRLEAPSRILNKDSSLYGFTEEAEKSASKYMGWTNLCSSPPLNPDSITAFASQIRCEGLEAIVLIGQGGSTQASMTITKLNSLEVEDIPFRTMDSLSPVYVSHILGSSDPAKTLYIVSSKSGGTIEPLMLLNVVWQYVEAHLGEDGVSKRFVAITDPNSLLANLAKERKFRAVFSGSEDIGGRYSALSVFGLLPMALVGINVNEVIKRGKETQELCSKNDSENPALRLACFLYQNYVEGRDKFSLVMPPAGQVFGLWIEQLVAESLGKDGKGILPNVEVDAGLLSEYRSDRTAITYEFGSSQAFHDSLDCINKEIPQVHAVIENSIDIVNHFIIWEFAVAMCAVLMEVDPFNQPDVEITKKIVKNILYSEGPSSSSEEFIFTEEIEDADYVLFLEKSINLNDKSQFSIDSALKSLFSSINQGDYFSLEAYLPFFETGRREALERMRHRVADRIGSTSCLEIGPRYLHSTGQLHKGGPNNGVYLILSAKELHDMPIPGESFTLGELVLAQAQADFEALSQRGRRVLHIHLKDNDSRTLSALADRICAAITASQAQYLQQLGK